MIKDELIISRVLQGEKQAFAMLLAKYQDMVFSICLKMVKDRDMAEELAQVSFVKAYTSLASYSSKAKFSTWLYRICYNSCLDHLKRVQGKRFQDIQEVELTSEQTLDPSKVLENKEDKERVRNAIQELDPATQVLVLLFYFEEQSVKEISEILQLSVSNVKVKLYRARKQLQNLLTPSYER